jgi:hypothetical protein
MSADRSEAVPARILLRGGCPDIVDDKRRQANAIHDVQVALRASGVRSRILSPRLRKICPRMTTISPLFNPATPTSAGPGKPLFGAP